MFRDRKFLIEKGMYASCREDTFQFVGQFYDEYINTGTVCYENYLKLKEYLENHRENINNKDYSLIKYDSLMNRLRETFGGNIQKDSDLKNIPRQNTLKKVEKAKDIDISKKHGVYGIYLNDRLLYIGETTINFKTRFQQHRQGLKNQSADLYVKLKKIYDNKTEQEELYFKPLVVIEDLKMIGKIKINEKELKCMELALITAMKPELNIQGVVEPYSFY